MVRYRTLPQFILTNRYVARRPESLSDYPVLNEIPRVRPSGSATSQVNNNTAASPASFFDRPLTVLAEQVPTHQFHQPIYHNFAKSFGTWR